MNEYLYFCKNCKALEISKRNNAKIICEECGARYYPLHVTERDWDKMDKATKKEVLMHAISPSNKLMKTNSNNSRLKSQVQLQAEEHNTNRVMKTLLKLSDSKENQTSKLSKIGFLFSFLGCLSFVGLAAGIFDLVKGKGKKSLSIAAIVISSIMMLGTIGLMGGTSDSSNERTMAESCEDSEDETERSDYRQAIPTPLPTSSQDVTPISTSADNDKVLEENNTNESSGEGSGKSSAEAEQPIEITMYATDKVNIRQQPNTECEVLGKANVGDEVVVLETGVDGWSHVSCGGLDGYIKSEYLCDQAPVQNIAAQNNTATDVATQADVGTTAAAAAVAATTLPTAVGGGENGDNFNLYDVPEQQQTSSNWVLNTNTMKIHYPSCNSVRKIKPENYSTSNMSVAELMAQGYDPCGNCHPH